MSGEADLGWWLMSLITIALFFWFLRVFANWQGSGFFGLRLCMVLLAGALAYVPGLIAWLIWLN